MRPWQLLSSELVYNHPWYKLRKDHVLLPNGKVVDDYHVSVRPDAVFVFAVTSDNNVLLVRQYKHGVRQITLELPAGLVGGESTERAAIRELEEETGYRCRDLALVASLTADTTRNTNRMHVFLGQGAEKIGAQQLDEMEAASGVEVVVVPLEQIIELIRNGDIDSQTSVAAIYRCLDALGG